MGGLVAACAMNQFQLLLKTAVRVYKGPPADAEKEAEKDAEISAAGEDATVKTARAISRGLANHELTPSEAKWTGPTVHYVFGTVLGAIYGAIAVSPRPISVAAKGYGTLYGAGVWLTADEWAVPALGLSGASSSSSKVPSKVKTLSAHLVYGVTTYFVHQRLLKRKMLLNPTRKLLR